eukprot:TRINITY_DN7145_c0_g1_i1.p1 TRINITY_DN7145_c0_g1~~TRINITY_DN7145_c0_g1_i1.p1  ORF type:complete len:1039 (-),score=269.75 TRINITY_DN7145_c0_g1_i1:137-3253(-)
MGCSCSVLKPIDDFATQETTQGGESAKYSEPLSQDNLEYNGAPKPLQQRVIASDGVLEHKFPSGFKIRYSWVSQTGFYPDEMDKANQDSCNSIVPFGQDEDRCFFGVYDGHGKFGDLCSQFARDTVSQVLENHPLYQSDFDLAYTECFEESNRLLHRQHNAPKPVDDTLSGTTAITVFFNGNQINVANVGDSRAIIGQTDGDGNLIAYPLSIDQTPYRQDECDRAEAAGARVLTMDQIDGYKDPNARNWGEEEDDDGDPPRLWLPDARFPGTAFTRSIGDACAETIGVFATPELLTKRLTPEDKYIVIASDGIFEFISSQTVMDMVKECKEPMDACRALVCEAYKLWLQYEVRTDDITCIVIELSELEGAQTTEEARGAAAGIEKGTKVVVGGEARPVRRNVSRAKRNFIHAETEGAATSSIEELFVPPSSFSGTAEEKSRIEVAVQTNFLFRPLTPQQREIAFNCMQKVDVKAGDVIIKQNDPGDCFYIVDSGEFDVLVNDELVHKYDCHHGNPSFGELALMYSKPRAATVVATTGGVIWSLDRVAFKSILLQVPHLSQTLLTALKKNNLMRVLKRGLMQRLIERIDIITLPKGKEISAAGKPSPAFFIVLKGSVSIMSNGSEVGQLNVPECFGESSLLNETDYESYVAAEEVKLGRITREKFEGTLGPIDELTRKHTVARERQRRVSFQLLSKQQKEGLFKLTLNKLEVSSLVFQHEHFAIKRVLHRDTGKTFALKIYNKNQVVKVKQQQQVMRERNLLVSEEFMTSSCVFIPRVATVFQDDSNLFFLMRSKLRPDLNLLKILSESFSLAHSKFYAASLVLALERLHQVGVVYRSLTPELLGFDDRGYIQLLDFTSAKVVEEDRTFTLVGNPEYLSPEQVKQTGHGLGADWWSLGVILYEMLSGETPFSGKNEMDTFKKITSFSGLTYPQNFPEEAKSLVEALLKPEQQRLGCQGKGAVELMHHPFFGDMDWEALRKAELKAPINFSNPEELARFIVNYDDDVAAISEDSYTGDTSWFKGFEIDSTSPSVRHILSA